MAATGAEIANAYVAVVTKMPNLQRDLNKQFGAVDTSRAGQDMGSKLASGMKKTLKAASVAVGGVIAAGIGTALYKGFGRLNAIDQATAKLRGLGHDAKNVDTIMKNALASVKGTAFGLDEAATVAASAVAAGIKPGKELEGVLKSVANSAAAAGVDMGEMGAIYAKVASVGKAQNDSLRQVADRGIPIYQALADQLGVTTDEVFKMASAGEIGFAEFEKAMTTAAGTVADEMGNTVQGSWSNFLASLGRIGAGVLGGVFGQLAPVLQGVTQAFGPLEDVAASVGEKIGDWLVPVVEKFLSLLDGGVDLSMFTPLGVAFKTLEPVLPVVAGAIGDIASTIGGVLAAVLPAIIPILAMLIESFGELAKSVLPPVAKLIGALAPIVTMLVKLALIPLAFILEPLAPLIEVLGKALAPVAELIAMVVTPVVELLSIAIEWVADVISDAASNVIPQMGSAFDSVWAVIEPIWNAFAEKSQWLFENILLPAFSAVQVAFAILAGILAGVWKSIIKPMFDAFAKVMQWLYNTIVKPILDAIGKAFKWAWETIIKPVVDKLMVGLDVLGGVFRWLYNSVVKPVWDWISSKIKTVWEDKIKPVLDTLSKVVKKDPKEAFEAARDAIGRAWDGIKNLAKKPVKFVVETVINGLIGTMNKLPGVNLKKVALPRGFASGGYTGNLPVDAVAGVVHGNEHVIRAQSRERIERSHPGLLDHMNQYGTVPGYKKGGMVHPLPSGRITTYWMGYPGHKGMDFAAPQGTPIRAAAAGAVNHAAYYGGWGNMVKIDHGKGMQTLYAHIMPGGFRVKVGDYVRPGQHIANVGTTGFSTGPHLHYEVWKNGVAVNPLPYVTGAKIIDGKAGGDWGAMLGLVDWAKNKFAKAFPGGGMFVDAAGGVMREAVGQVVDWGKKKLSIGGATLYDDGGWLDPGTHLVQNKTRRPEPILTGSQWDALERSATGGGMPSVLVIKDVDDKLVGRMRVEAGEVVLTGLSGASQTALRMG